LRLNAAAIIMAHNHPSGLAQASTADLNLTKHLKQALALIDVRLLDHIIATGKETISLAEKGQF
jgi:DNA repair protein RadC